MTDNTQLFDNFLGGSLSKEQKEDFLERLESDASFKEDFEHHQLAIEVILASKEESLRQQLQQIHSEPKKGKLVSMNLRLIYAAAILVVIFGVATVWQIMGPKSPQDLYAEYHIVDEGPSLTRGSESFSAWEQFIQDYQAGSFEESLVQLHQAEIDGFEPVYLIRYYQGICMMNTDIPDFDAAISRFEQVLAADNDYHGASLWLLGLCQLKQEKMDEAKETFQHVLANFPSHSQQAKAILEDL